MINARSETLLKKPTFQPLLTSRCIVPATAYFEWRVAGKTRVKNRIFLSDSEAFALAALTNGNEIIILTCLPLPEIAHIHRRMPIILSQDTEKIWIDSTRATPDLLKITRLNYVLALKFEEENTGSFNQRELF